MKILRSYVSLKDKYTLIKIKPFQTLLTDRYTWIQRPKKSLANLKLHDKYLLSKFKSGFYITPERRSIFQILIDYKSPGVTLLEFHSKKTVHKRFFSIHKKYTVSEIHKLLTTFYTIAYPVQKHHVFETWNREIVTFDSDSGIFRKNFDEECIMTRCHFDVFRSRDFKTFLLYDGNNTLTIFLVNHLFANNHIDLCSYLYHTRNFGNEMFQYEFPTLANFVKLIKAFSFKKSFKCTNSVKFKYLSQTHFIQCNFINRYESHSDIYDTSYKIFQVYAS